MTFSRIHTVWLQLLWATLLSCLFISASHAQVVSVKGVGSVTYSFMLSAGDKDNAYRLAQVAAVERYFAENGEAESENFEAIQDTISANLDKFILSTTVLNEQDKNKRYSVTVKSEINVAKLRNTLRKSSPVAQASKTNAVKSQMVYLFIAREVASVKSFDDRVVKRNEKSIDGNVEQSYEDSTHESEKVKGSAISTKQSASKSDKIKGKVSVTTESGGSKTARSDDVAYRLLPMANHKTSITSTFSQSGFLVADPEFILDDAELALVNKDYSAGNDLAPSTIRKVVATLKQSNIPYLVLVTLDLNSPQ